MKLYTLGELLVDFTPVEVGNHSVPVYEQNPGGIPALPKRETIDEMVTKHSGI
ncbi:hypothetical protein ACFO0S_04425 [Chryseomicrobium palamuruense]|uniref:Carbohydrate kinase PfkB domain-containing protein n=1 Tax=Chryseomicrobium palamuruense TaxID=682973 RepID=A0ABV8UUZ8_9BACL